MMFSSVVLPEGQARPVLSRQPVLAGFLRDDPDGVREMLDAVERLADEPRPAGSFPMGP